MLISYEKHFNVQLYKMIKIYYKSTFRLFRWQVIGKFLPFPLVLTVASFLGATFISVLVGIIPAINVSKLDPIKATYK